MAFCFTSLRVAESQLPHGFPSLITAIGWGGYFSVTPLWLSHMVPYPLPTQRVSHMNTFNVIAAPPLATIFTIWTSSFQNRFFFSRTQDKGRRHKFNHSPWLHLLPLPKKSDVIICIMFPTLRNPWHIKINLSFEISDLYINCFVDGQSLPKWQANETPISHCRPPTWHNLSDQLCLTKHFPADNKAANL